MTRQTTAVDLDQDLTLDQVAHVFNIKLERAQELRRRQEFPGAYNVGTDRRPEWRIPKKALEAFRQARRGTA